jgi:hypothetical protein
MSTRSNEEIFNAKFETHGVNVQLAATSAIRVVQYTCAEGRQTKEGASANPKQHACFQAKPI